MRPLDQAFESVTRLNAAALASIINTPLVQRDLANLKATGQSIVSRDTEFRALLAQIGDSPRLLLAIHNIYSSL